MVEQHGGELPADEAALRELPGIGPYTAAAIAAIAFGARTFALDGNGARVLARVFGEERRHRSAGGARASCARAALALVPGGSAGRLRRRR